MKRAEPKKLTTEELIQVEALAQVLSSQQIADYLGISRSTFYSIMDRQPEVAGRYKKGRSKAIGSVAHGLLKRAQDGDTASAIFYLKTQAGWKETSVNEHTGKDGGPIETKSVREMTDEDLLKIINDDKD